MGKRDGRPFLCIGIALLTAGLGLTAAAVWESHWLVPLWGSADHAYLLRFRPASAFVWRWYPILIPSAGLLLGGACLLRWTSGRSGAAGFIGVAAALELLFVCGAFLNLCAGRLVHM